MTEDADHLFICFFVSLCLFGEMPKYFPFFIVCLLIKYEFFKRSYWKSFVRYTFANTLTQSVACFFVFLTASLEE